MARKAIPELTILKVLSRQSRKCNHCFNKLETTADGVKLYDIDHIEMHSLTKNNDVSNLQALCLCCHRVKTTHEIRERRKHYKDTSCDLKIVNKVKPECNIFSKFKYNFNSA
jgi:hypothetical protein